MVVIIVVYAECWFKIVFKYMCAALGIIYWPLARGNHKGINIEKYHLFLKKTQSISGQDRVTHEVFLQNKKTSQYAWNSASIDGIDILRSVSSAGWEFRFLLDVKLIQTPTTLNQGNSGLYEYLWNLSNKTQFTTPILNILVEERRNAHR